MLRRIVSQESHRVSKSISSVFSLLRKPSPYVQFLERCGFLRNSRDKQRYTIDLVTSESRISIEEMQNLLAEYGVCYQKTIMLPPRSVLKKTMTELVKIKDLDFLLCSTEHNENIVFATNVVFKAFDTKRIAGNEIVLCDTSVLQKHWKSFETLHLFYSEFLREAASWQKVLFYCLYDAYRAGADGVDIVKSFETCTYSFNVADKQYSGKIDVRVLEGILTLRDSSLGEISSIYGYLFPLGNGFCEIKAQASSSHAHISFIPDRRHTTPSITRGNETRPHVLLIDDDERFLSLMKRGVSSKGYTVSVSVSANDALLMYLKSNAGIDLIVTDLHMPHINGVELIRTIKQYSQDLPIIALTSDEDTKAEVSLIRAGANVIIHKQEDPLLLFEWMDKLLSVRST